MKNLLIEIILDWLPMVAIASYLGYILIDLL